MSEVVKVAGLRMKIDGAAEFERSLASIGTALKNNSTELSKIQAQYGKNATSVEALTAKKQALASKLENTRDKMAAYKEILAETEEKYGANSKCKQSSKMHTFTPANAHFFTASF